MKRSLLIFMAGLVVAAAAYFGLYYGSTADTRKLQKTGEWV